jgi:hypothetical protein
VTRKQILGHHAEGRAMSNTRKRFCLFVLSLTFVFLNCCARECQLEGEVFIVTKGGHNVKLGLVEVKALPEKEILAFIEKKKAEAKEKIGGVTTERNRCQSEYIKAQSEYNKRFFASGLKLFDRLLDAKMTALKEYNIAESAYHYWSNGIYLFDNLPEGEVSAKTNSDGKFIMTLKRNTTYALIAHAQRDVFNNVEKYYWMVWFIPKDKTNTIFLSNDNFFDVDSPNNLVKRADLPQ